MAKMFEVNTMKGSVVTAKMAGMLSTAKRTSLASISSCLLYTSTSSEKRRIPNRLRISSSTHAMSFLRKFVFRAPGYKHNGNEGSTVFTSGFMRAPHCCAAPRCVRPAAGGS